MSRMRLALDLARWFYRSTTPGLISIGWLSCKSRTYEPIPLYAAGKSQQPQAKQGPAGLAIPSFKDAADAAAAILGRLRQLELASIAIAGLALHYAGNHEIRDIALRGIAVDYFVGEERLSPGRCRSTASAG